MEFFTQAQFRTLFNPGVESVQLLSPHNSSASRITITRVTMQPGAGQPRHSHPASEQIWLAISGSGTLLLADGATRGFAAGEVARFAEGDVHGFENSTSERFVYMSVTTPPVDFAYAYRADR
jgi:quercetin dioxygenase-like cupin family protein